MFVHGTITVTINYKKFGLNMINKKRSPFCIIVVTLLITSIFFILFLNYNDIPLVKRSNAIYISSSEKEKVIEALQKGGVAFHWADYLVLEVIDLPKEGWYRIKEDSKGRFYFFHTLAQQKASTMGIVIFAGETVEEIFDRLNKDMSLDKEKLAGFYEKYSRFLEGEILADRYIMAKNADEEVTIRYLLDQSSIELDFFAKERFGSEYSKLQLHQALIIASIIHKESNNLAEMGSIASVINNRLKKGMRLQMDGTLCYGKYSHTVVTPERIKNDTSYFNTYKHKGLPPYPICTVTMDALEAATFPKESNYLYFMLDRDGTHNFASDYDEHRKNIKDFRNNVSIKRDKKRKIEDKKRVKEEKKVVKIDIDKKKKVVKENSKESNENDNNISKEIKIKKESKEQNSTQKPIDEKLAIEILEENRTNFIKNIDKNDSYLSVF